MTSPAHEPTDRDRRQAELLSGYGVRHTVIAKALGICQMTLYRYYRAELDRGMAVAHGQVGKALYEKAVVDRDTGALIWWTKTQMGWKDTSRVEHVGDGGGPIQVESRHVDLSMATDDELDALERTIERIAPDAA